MSDRYPRLRTSSVHVFSSSCRIHTSHIRDLFSAGPKHLVGPLRCHTGFYGVRVNKLVQVGSISSAPSLPTASPSARNLCCEERQQRTTHKTFGKSA